MIPENYRIVYKETKDDSGKIVFEETYYKIQKKFLWFWVDVSIRCAEKVVTGHRSSSGVQFHRCGVFWTKQNAEKMLQEYILNDYSEIYKGNHIIKAYAPPWTDKTIYVNKSRVPNKFDYPYCYEYDFSLENLKQRIDARIKTTKTTIV